MSDTDAARKRRILMRNQKRSPAPFESEDESTSKRLRMEDQGDEALAEPVTSKPKPHITGIKKQSRYDPGVPMTREELKAWRKEARRVRNRESAAASRKKNREAVSYLQEEIDSIKTKYAAALKLIIELEASRSASDCATFTPPSLLRQDLLDAHMGAATRSASPGAVQTVSPPLSPATEASSVASNEDLLYGMSLACPGQPSQHQAQADNDLSQDHQHHNQSHQHIMNMISRPIACILPGADADSSVMTAVNGSNVSRQDGYGNQETPPSGMYDVFTDQEMERLAAPPAPPSVSDSGSSECSDDNVPIHHDSLDESELGEFLMDTFPGDDVMAAMTDISELAAI
ncbi:MAG: hypothetical protein SGARI_004171 [Bacillariaceae sp.]